MPALEKAFSETEKGEKLNSRPDIHCRIHFPIFPPCKSRLSIFL